MELTVTLHIGNNLFCVHDIERILCFSCYDENSPKLPSWLLKEYGPGTAPNPRNYLPANGKKPSEYMQDKYEYEKCFTNFIRDWYNGAIEKLILLQLEKNSAYPFGHNIAIFEANIPDRISENEIIESAKIIPDLISLIIKKHKNNTANIEENAIQGSIFLQGEYANHRIKFICDAEKAHIETPEIISFTIPEFEKFSFCFNELVTNYYNHTRYFVQIAIENKELGHFTFDCRTGKSEEELKQILFKELVSDYEDCETFEKWVSKQFNYLPKKYNSEYEKMLAVYDRKQNNIQNICKMFGSKDKFRKFMNLNEPQEYHTVSPSM